MTFPSATLHDIAGKPVLRFERRLDHPPEKVWRAITNPDDLAHWFPARIETEWQVGAPMRFIMDEPGIEETSGQIVELEAPRLFVFHWDGDVLRFEIVPDGAGCTLYFSHTLSGGGTWGGRRFAAQHAAGWDQCLALLDARLAGRTLDAGVDDWFEPFEAYVEKFGLATGEAVRISDDYEVRFERIVTQPPAAVWSALSGGDVLAEGMAPPAAHADSIANLLASWQVYLERFVAGLSGVTRPWLADRVDLLTKWYAGHAAD